MKDYKEPSMTVVKLMNNDVVVTDLPIKSVAPTEPGPGDACVVFPTGEPCFPDNSDDVAK